MPVRLRDKLKGMPKELIFIGGMLTIVEGILWYFLPIYFESKMNNMFLVGVIISAYSAGRLLVSLPAGDIADRIGRKFTFILGVLGFVASLFFLFFDGFLYFALFMMLFGMFTIIYGIPAYAALMDYSTKKNVPMVAGLADMLNNFGWGFGPMIAGALLLYLNAPSFIGVVIVILLGVSVFSLFFFPGKFHFGMKEFRKSKTILVKDGLYLGEMKRLKKLGRPLLAILTFSFAFGFWEYAVWTFVPIWASSMGAGLLLGAFILMLDSLPYIPFSFISGAVTNRLGMRRMFAIGAVFTLLGQTFFMFEQSLLTLTLTLVVTPIGVSFLAIPMDVYIRRNVGKGIYGQVYGIDYMIYEIGGIIAPLTVGAIAIFSNMSSIIYVTFALFVVSIGALSFLFLKN